LIFDEVTEKNKLAPFWPTVYILVGQKLHIFNISRRCNCSRYDDQLSLKNPARRSASRRTCRWTLSVINLRPS